MFWFMLFSQFDVEPVVSLHFQDTTPKYNEEDRLSVF